MTKFYFALFLVFTFLSCKRDLPKDDQQAATTRIIEKVPLWFERQIKSNKLFAGKIQILKDNLELNKSNIESEGSKKILVIPIKKELALLNNKDKGPVNNLVLFLNDQDEISGSRIVQFVSAVKEKKLPANTIVKLLNSKDVDCDGTFTFLNIIDRFLYEMKFGGGKKTDFSYMKPKVSKAGEQKEVQGFPGVRCRDWYLITKHYNSDGTVEIWEDYLGRTCDGCMPATTKIETSICGELVDEVGGGGGEDDCCLVSPNAVLTSDAISEKVPDECGLETIDPVSGLVTKTCLYKWYYNSSSLLWYNWKYQSVETAILEKYGSNWKFKSFAHTGRLIEGSRPVNCITVSDEHYATASISTDRTQAKMIINATITVNVTCSPWTSPATKSISAYAVWNAA